jgi:hypothetical protein
MSKKLTGKAKQKARKLKQKAMKNGAPKMKVDTNSGMPSTLTDYLLALIDDAPDHASDVLKGLINSTTKNPENLAMLTKHSKINKTSEQPCSSICVGNNFHQFDPIHFGPQRGTDTDTMIAIFDEFVNDKDAKLNPTLHMVRDIQKLEIGVGYMGKLGNIQVGYITNNGVKRAFVSAIASSTCNSMDLTGENVA